MRSVDMVTNGTAGAPGKVASSYTLLIAMSTRNADGGGPSFWFFGRPWKCEIWVEVSSVKKSWLCWALMFVCLFVFVSVLYCETQRKHVASQILPVGFGFVISDLVQLLHGTGQDAKGKHDTCVYIVSDSLRGLKPGLRAFNLFLLLFYHAVPSISFSDHFLLCIEGKQHP